MLRRIFFANIIFPKNSGRWKSGAAVSAAFRAGKCGRGVVMYALCAGENDRSTGNVLVNDGERTGGLVIDGGALRFADGQNDLTVFHTPLTVPLSRSSFKVSLGSRLAIKSSRGISSMASMSSRVVVQP